VLRSDRTTVACHEALPQFFKRPIESLRLCFIAARRVSVPGVGVSPPHDEARYHRQQFVLGDAVELAEAFEQRELFGVGDAPNAALRDDMARQRNAAPL
jgi:hypothetical protein